MKAICEIPWMILHALLTAGLFLIAPFARLSKREIDVGLGPQPLQNNPHHKKALECTGYSAETFVTKTTYRGLTWDYVAVERLPKWLHAFAPYLLHLRALFRYRCVYIYFRGGPLHVAPFANRAEPWLFRMAGTKVVVMPYGGDVFVPHLCPNLTFRHVIDKQYPERRETYNHVASQVRRWMKGASHVISGCDWVDYMPFWDTLTVAHFSIDMSEWSADLPPWNPNEPLRILHAPQHRAVKGTDHFVEAVNALREEGRNVELVLLENVPNAEVRDVMASCHMIADQLFIGWYGLFTLEGMSMGKPVLCNIRQDLLNLYISAGLLAPDELPIIQCNVHTVAESIRKLMDHPEDLARASSESIEYVRNHHSTEAVGQIFARINEAIGLRPSQATASSLPAND